MSKATIVLSVLVLTGCASTSGWRALTIDGSSQSTFEESRALIEQALPTARSQLFAQALQDIWVTGAATAADDDEYTAEDYFEQLDGLGYEEVVALADSTGLLGYRYSAPARRGARSVPVSFPSNQSASGAHGWGTRTTDPFDPSPTGWRPTP